MAASKPVMTWMTRRATAGVAARLASRCSAPISSGVSARIEVHPSAISRSDATPRAGLAVIPDRASEPPHSRPNTMPDICIGSRLAPAASFTRLATSGRAASTVPSVPR